MKFSGNNAAGGDKKLYTQLRNLRTIFDLANHAVISEKRALDRFLSSYWRENRCFGSRDRRLFSESIFAFFRFYGWLKTLLTAEEQELLMQGCSRQLSGRSIAMLLAAAWQLENLEPEPAHRLLAREFELPALSGREKNTENDPDWRRKRFAAIAGKMTGRSVELPAWELLQSPWSLEFLQDMDDRNEYLAKLAERPPLWLRVQNAPVESVVQELAQAGLSVKRHERLTNALAVVSGSVNLYTLPAYREGRVEVQDLASQVIAAVCSPDKGERWWDCCAGAGGKTLAIAEAMQRTGTVIAGDIREKVLLELRKRARRAGYPNIQTRQHDGKPWRGLKPFDGILIDAPCSCSGVWRRNPGNPWLLTPQAVSRHAALQLEILRNFAGCVKVGGKVIYATCSAFEEENESVIKSFLASDDRFVLKESVDPFTGNTCCGFMHIPENCNCDLMFAAMLERKK